MWGRHFSWERGGSLLFRFFGSSSQLRLRILGQNAIDHFVPEFLRLFQLRPVAGFLKPDQFSTNHLRGKFFGCSKSLGDCEVPPHLRGSG
jgi:hypothetical protein